MFAWWRALWAWLRPVAVTPVVALPPPPPLPPHKGKILRSGNIRLGPNDNIYEFTLRGDILDRLGDYFMLIDRMRKGDHEAYRFYRQLGANLLPWLASQRYRKEEKDPEFSVSISPWFLQALPGFGAVMWTRPQEDDYDKATFAPRFIYFNKYAPRGAPVELQPVSGGVIYKVTVYWDMPGDPKWKRSSGAPTEFGVCLFPDGRVQVLRTLLTKHISIRGKRNRANGRGRRQYGTSFTRREWGHSEFFREWAGSHQQQVEDYLAWIFGLAAASHEIANYGMFKVTVRQGKLTATFNISAKRSAYFFRDRDDVVGAEKKRIFHIVRPHMRQRGEKSSAVKLHFRGLQDFTWNGYAVRITVPGVHHTQIQECDLESMDQERWDGKETGMWQHEFGGILAEHVQKGWPVLQRFAERRKLRKQQQQENAHDQT